MSFFRGRFCQYYFISTKPFHFIFQNRAEANRFFDVSFVGELRMTGAEPKRLDEEDFLDDDDDRGLDDILEECDDRGLGDEDIFLLVLGDEDFLGVRGDSFMSPLGLIF